MTLRPVVSNQTRLFNIEKYSMKREGRGSVSITLPLPNHQLLYENATVIKMHRNTSKMQVSGLRKVVQVNKLFQPICHRMSQSPNYCSTLL